MGVIKKLLMCLSFSIMIFAQSIYADQIHWKVQSNKPAHSAPYNLELIFANRVAELTNNQLIIKIRPPGGFFPIRSTFNAVRTEQLDAMFMSPQYWSGADPVFAIMGDLIAAWDTPQEYAEWLSNDNGIQYLHNSYSSFGLTLINLLIAPHESLVSNVAIRNIQDIAGQRIRTPPGMATDYFSQLGAFPRQISLDKVKTALEKNQISITDFSDIVFNDMINLYQNAKHTNYPGFHSISVVDFVVNSKVWNKLTHTQKNAVTLASNEWKESLKITYEQEITKTILKLTKNGVIIHNWSPEARMEARKRAIPVWMKYAKKSPQADIIIKELLLKLQSIGNL